MSYRVLLLVIMLVLGIALRLYRLDDIPPGLNPDEASIGYNAYSLLETGKDRYGETLPLAFRSLGTYILPVYTYLTIIPTAIFGPTIFSARFISAVSSIVLIIITLAVVFEIKKISFRSRLLAGLFISISPWAVYFGRGGHEISLSLTFFALSILLFIKSLSNPKWIILTLLIAGLSGMTYYTERYLNLIFFPLLLWLFKDKFIKYKKFLLIGIVLFLIIQLPQLFLIQSEAFSRRIEQVNYWNDKFVSGPFAKIAILKEFTSHYLEYFSPRSLFVDPDPQGARSMPDLSIFYIWMIIPLWFGIKFLWKNRSDPVLKTLLLLLIVSPIPAALTKDPFYSLRALLFFWVLTIIISFGADYLIGRIKIKSMGIILSIIVLLISLISLYNSYFILLNYERGDNYGYEYKELVNKLKEYPGKKIVIDSSRVIGAQIWIPFYAKIDPLHYQQQISDKIKNSYYNNTDLEIETKIDNFDIRPIIWHKDICEDEILVGDQLAISDEQAQEHKLTLLFPVTGLDGKTKLTAYITNPRAKCGSNSQFSIVSAAQITFLTETELINPNLLIYPLKRLYEEIRLNLLPGKQQKREYFYHLFEVRFRELVYIVNHKKEGFIVFTADRYNSFAGKIKKDYPPDSTNSRRFKTYLKLLERLRDIYPANSEYWEKLQQTIDITHSLI